MSVATLITGGLGTFGAVSLLLLDGLGAFGPGATTGGGDYSQWEGPPFTPVGYRNILDTSGVDLAAQDRARMEALRREIGLIRDEPEVIAPRVVVVPPVVVESEPPLPEPFRFDQARYAAVVAAALRDTIASVDSEKAELARLDWIRRDEEAVLLLLAGVV